MVRWEKILLLLTLVLLIKKLNKIGMTEATLATHSNVKGFIKDGSIGVIVLHTINLHNYLLILFVIALYRSLSHSANPRFDALIQKRVFE